MIAIDLHLFGDASILANCAAVYTVVYQPGINIKGLLGSKSRILSVLKTNNTRSVLGWTNGTVVFCWLSQSESYKPFVANRVSKIKQNDYIKWQCTKSSRYWK